MAALRCAWIKISSRGAEVLRYGVISGAHNNSKPSVSTAQMVCRRGIHRAITKLQPTKVPMTDEERKLLEKLGEPDQETRGYLNELYNEFDVGAEKRKGQRQQKTNMDTSKDKSREDASPAASARPIHRIAGVGLSTKNIARLLHISVIRNYQANDSFKQSDNLTNVKPSMKKRSRELTDEAEVIWDSQEKLDLDETYMDYYPKNKKGDRLVDLNLKRGEDGVFDVDELVTLLREERMLDVVVIETPPKLPYADYLIICTAISVRQAKAITQHLKKMFKRKKNLSDPPIKIEGLDCDEWKVLDMENIVLHIFDHETRGKYNLETLWTVGADMDELARGITEQDEVDVLEQHMNFVRSLTPQQTISRSST
ncbi:hypothetical protein BIW11_03285 [Tropilaelaps mercedesae]|uniref:Mitochondrial assembly of ribosomal large subunit protein 1 n=1 Tax=Tropilaelaps mercedesae TaxID=418985 RepID=A0A1V9XPE6_9ACAR|nr:hypothetical protein BIW11_03285 [Tropilaelaps mercedesae]